MSGSGVRTTVVHPERHVPHFVSRNTRRPREERSARCDGERGRCPPPDLSPVILSLRYTTFFRPLTLSLSILLAPLARAPRLPPSNPLRHALACVNHAYRFSFVGVSEGRSVALTYTPLPSLFPPLSHSLSLSVPRLSLSFRRRARGPRRATNPLLKTYTRYLILFAQWPVFSLSFCALAPLFSLSLFLLFCYPRPLLRVPLAYEALDAYTSLFPVYL